MFEGADERAVGRRIRTRRKRWRHEAGLQLANHLLRHLGIRRRRGRVERRQRQAAALRLLVVAADAVAADDRVVIRRRRRRMRRHRHGSRGRPLAGRLGWSAFLGLRETGARRGAPPREDANDATPL